MVGRSEILSGAKTLIVRALGGAADLPVILILAAVLGLDSADKGTLSAVSRPLQETFGIGNTELGLLFAAVSFIGAIGTIPVGILADRIRRKTILLVVVPIWAFAIILSGTASSYIYLLITRLLLGFVTAAAWPCVASLAGDFFPARKRAEIYGLIVAGELVGAGIGFFIAGEISTWTSWRWSFYVMGLPSFALAWIIWRYLPEPARSGQEWLDSDGSRSGSAGESPPGPTSLVQHAVREMEVEPRTQLILRDDPSRQSWWWAIRYLVRVPTYLLLIGASALVYFVFSGTRAFGMIYFTEHYHIGRGVVSALIFIIGLGALIGVVGGGRLSGWFLKRGMLQARILMPGIALLAATILLGFGIWTHSLAFGIVTVTAGVAALAAAIPPIDAARLDIVHPRLWGRAESGRVVLRATLEGAAPLLFGALPGWLGGGDEGLEWTFLLMLIPMLAASAFALPGRRTYPRDVATAAASMEATSQRDATKHQATRARRGGE